MAVIPQLRIKTIEYPERDGQPLGETGFHVTLIAYCLSMLRSFFRGRTDVYVGSNMFVYYHEGEPRKSVAPDLFIAFGVSGHERRVWKVWEEGKGPDVVFEFSSRETWDEDLGSKKGLYEWMGVQEYFLFDLLEEYLEPRLQGFRLEGGAYRPLLPTGPEELVSESLGLVLRAKEDELQMFRSDTGERLLPPLELAEGLEAAESHLQAAQTEIARLQAEIDRLKRGE